MPKPRYLDDRDQLDEAEIVKIKWPKQVKKPIFGIVQDDDQYPKWTKYRRFLENNAFDYNLYFIHRHDWIEQAEKFDIIIGIPSNSFFVLQELRIKYEILETYLGKVCYPSSAHMRLYEDKCFESYISKATGIPFAKTYISQDEKDALALIGNLDYPTVSKIIPSSGSYGVELVKNQNQARRIINDVFSIGGRKTHLVSYRQKNIVYFQDFVPNDGYDIRIVVIGNLISGFYRKAPSGDFRASGMGLEEKKELPDEAMRMARRVNNIIQSPMLAVDFLHGVDGKYTIVEFSPSFQTNSPDELHVKGIPGVYVFDPDGTYHFLQGKFWLAELSLREFLLKYYLPERL